MPVGLTTAYMSAWLQGASVSFWEGGPSFAFPTSLPTEVLPFSSVWDRTETFRKWPGLISFFEGWKEDSPHVLYTHDEETASPCRIIMAAGEVVACIAPFSFLTGTQPLSQGKPIPLFSRTACALRRTTLPAQDWFRNEQATHTVRCEQEASEESFHFPKREQEKMWSQLFPWTLL